MDPVRFSTQQSVPCSRTGSTRLTTMAHSLALNSDTKYFAYKLGYLSRTNIQREARKAEPRLYQLLGHATLFDNARKYINQHLDDEDGQADEVEEIDTNWDGEDDEPTFEYVEDVEVDEGLISGSQPICSQSTLSSKASSLQVMGTSRTLAVLHASPINIQNDRVPDWENDSNSSTESGDEDDDHWSDSTCDGDESFATHPKPKIFDAYPVKEAEYSTYNSRPEDDDIVLWAQQPRVMSYRQAEDLLVAAFG